MGNLFLVAEAVAVADGHELAVDVGFDLAAFGGGLIDFVGQLGEVVVVLLGAETAGLGEALTERLISLRKVKNHGHGDTDVLAGLFQSKAVGYVENDLFDRLLVLI